MIRRKSIFKTETFNTLFGNILYTVKDPLNDTISYKGTTLPSDSHFAVLRSRLKNKKDQYLCPDYNIIYSMNTIMTGSIYNYLYNYINGIDLIDLSLYLDKTISGAIDTYTITNGGTGYSLGQSFKIIGLVQRGTVGATIVTTPGTGYINGPATIKSPRGDLATCTVVAGTGGTLTSINTIENVSNFLQGEICQVIQSGTNNGYIQVTSLTGTVVTIAENDTAWGYVNGINGSGTITSINIVKTGFGYVYGQNLNFLFYNNSYKLALAARVTAIKSPFTNNDYIPDMESRIKSEAAEGSNPPIYKNRHQYVNYYTKGFAIPAIISGTGLELSPTITIHSTLYNVLRINNNGSLLGALTNSNLNYCYVTNWGDYHNDAPPIELQRGGGKETAVADTFVLRGTGVIETFDTITYPSDFQDGEIVKLIQGSNASALGIIVAPSSLILLSRGSGYSSGTATIQAHDDGRGDGNGTRIDGEIIIRTTLPTGSLSINTVSSNTQLYAIRINNTGAGYSNQTLPDFYIANTGMPGLTKPLTTTDFYNYMLNTFNWIDVNFTLLNYSYYTFNIEDTAFTSDSYPINMILYTILITGTPAGTGVAPQFKLLFRLKLFEDGKIPVLNDYINIKENFPTYLQGQYPDYPTDDVIQLSKYVGIDLGFIDLNFTDVSEILDYQSTVNGVRLKEILLKQMYMTVDAKVANLNKIIVLDKNNILKVITITPSYNSAYDTAGRKVISFSLTSESIDLQLEGVIEYDENVIEFSNLDIDNNPFVLLYTERRLILFDFNTKQIILEIPDYLNNDVAFNNFYELNELKDGIFEFVHKYDGSLRYYYVDYSDSQSQNIINNITNKTVSNTTTEYPIVLNGRELPYDMYKFEMLIENNTNYNQADTPTKPLSYVGIKRGKSLVEEKYDIIKNPNINLMLNIKDFPLYVRYNTIDDERQFVKYVNINIVPIKEL